MRKILFTTFFSLISIYAYAFEVTPGLEFRYDVNAQQPFNQYASIDVNHESEYVDFFLELLHM